MRWDFGVAAGRYAVRLYFAEIDTSVSASNERIFDVALEGLTYLNDLNVYTQVGHNRGLVETFVLDVTDGNLDIDFSSVVGNPLVSAIEVYRI
jgi:hypothetical protein